jgi:hypothetical protein
VGYAAAAQVGYADFGDEGDEGRSYGGVNGIASLFQYGGTGSGRFRPPGSNHTGHERSSSLSLLTILFYRS